VLGQDLGVAGVRGGAVEDERRDRATAHLLAQHPVVDVGQADAVALVRQEQVPQAVRAGALAELDEQARIGDAGTHLLVQGP
jgi:hypothetical protein